MYHTPVWKVRIRRRALKELIRLGEGFIIVRGAFRGELLNVQVEDGFVVGGAQSQLSLIALLTAVLTGLVGSFCIVTEGNHTHLDKVE